MAAASWEVDPVVAAVEVVEPLESPQLVAVVAGGACARDNCVAFDAAVVVDPVATADPMGAGDGAAEVADEDLHRTSLVKEN